MRREGPWRGRDARARRGQGAGTRTRPRKKGRNALLRAARQQIGDEEVNDSDNDAGEGRRKTHRIERKEMVRVRLLKNDINHPPAHRPAPPLSEPKRDATHLQRIPPHHARQRGDVPCHASAHAASASSSAPSSRAQRAAAMEAGSAEGHKTAGSKALGGRCSAKSLASHVSTGSASSSEVRGPSAGTGTRGTEIDGGRPLGSPTPRASPEEKPRPQTTVEKKMADTKQ